MNIETSKSVLHIGLQKTGSSYLQRFVFSGLSRKLGYRYINDSIHFRQIKRFDIDFKIEDREAFSKQLELGGKYILSYEGLIGGRPECWEERAKLIRSVFGDVAVVIAIRDPYHYLDALFLQKVKEGQFLHEEEFLDVDVPGSSLGYSRHAFSILDFEYLKLKAIYESNFDEVHFVPFEKLITSSVFLNGERIEFNNMNVTNRSLSKLSIEVIRFLGCNFPRLSRIFNENMNRQDFYRFNSDHNADWSKPRLSYSFIGRRLIDRVFKGDRYITNFNFTPEQIAHMNEQQKVYRSFLENSSL